jgi:hypothetical protein
MGNAKIIFGVAVAILVGVAGYQIGSCEVANLELREDLRDAATQNGPRLGITRPNSDDDIRDSVIRAGKEHGIQLTPDEIAIQRSGTAQEPVFSLAVDYKAPVKLPGYPLSLHFTVSSAR